MRENDTNINYTVADIERYNQGSMTTKEMHELERAALQDPFLADALEGYAEADMDVANKHLNHITALLQPQKEETKIIAMPARKSNWLRIAAAVVVIAGVGLGSIFLLNNKTNEGPLAANFKQTESKTDSSQAEEALANKLINKDAQAKTEPAIKADKKATEKPVIAENIKADKKTEEEQKSKRRTREDEVQKDRQISALATPNAQVSDEASLQSSSGFTASAPLPARIAGVVVDPNKKPVPNATIKMADSSIAVTDRYGEFFMNSFDSTQTAKVTAFGYKSAQAKLRKNVTDTIVLKEKKFLLSEVTETNMSTAKAKKWADSTTATPVGGWQSFQEYVYKKLNKTYDSTASSARINGSLELEFSINDDGLPYNFIVLQPADAQLTKDAIKAITEGPKWTPVTKDRKSRIRVKF